ncbi:Histone H1-delta [Schistosoma japonicum]|nr:Histone H1-delta [Schistosoma japonicum]
MYNSYEDNLNTNVEPRLFTRNICHGRKQRTSKHLDVKYHKPKDLLNDDKFDVNHNTNVDSDRVSKQTDSFSSNSLTHSDSSFNTSKYQQIELIEDTDENHQHCRLYNNNTNNNNQCYRYSNLPMKYLSSEV